MWCSRCNHDVSECTCPNIDERLAAANQHPNIQLATCDKCGKHVNRCTCVKDQVQMKAAVKRLGDASDLLNRASQKLSGQKMYDLASAANIIMPLDIVREQLGQTAGKLAQIILSLTAKLD